MGSLGLAAYSPTIFLTRGVGADGERGRSRKGGRGGGDRTIFWLQISRGEYLDLRYLSGGQV